MKVKITFVPESRSESATCKRMAKEAANPETALGKLVTAGVMKYKVRVAEVTVPLRDRRKKRA